VSRESRTSLRQSDFLIVRSKTDNSILKILTPQHFEIGLSEDAEFQRVLLVNGTIKSTMTMFAPALSGSLTTLLDGTSYLREGSNVTIESGSDGSVTISAGTSGIAHSLTGVESYGGIEDFTYDGTAAKTVKIDLFDDGGDWSAGTAAGLGLSLTTAGLALDPRACKYSVTTPAVDDLLFIHDASSTTWPTKSITVANLMTAATFGTLGNPITFGDGIYDSSANAPSYNNTAAVTIAVDLNSAGGLETVSPGELKIKLDGSTAALGVGGLSVASVPGSLTHGTGISSLSYDGSSGTTVGIDTSVVPRLGVANTFSAVNTFSALTGGGIIGSIQEVSPGLDYLIGGGNVTITKDLPNPGQITIAASLGAGGNLTQGSGIQGFTYNGTTAATVALDATSLSTTGDRTSYVFLSDGGTTITKESVGDLVDLADRTALVAPATNGGINISFPGAEVPAQFSVDLDGSTLVLGPGGISVGSVPYSLSEGLGIGTFSFDGSSAKTVAIDTAVVPRLNAVNTFTDANIFSAGISGSLTRLVDGTTYIREGTNVSISSGSDGAITISAVAGGGGIADGAAKYLVLEATGSLSNERVFVGGTGLDTVDNGAGNTFAVSVDSTVVQGRRNKDSYFLSSIYTPLQSISVASSDFSDASYDPDLIDILLNGQLMHSGSVSEVTALERDYYVDSATSLKFAFTLEIDDIIDVVVYKIV
jgi:hypothetical protein